MSAFAVSVSSIDTGQAQKATHLHANPSVTFADKVAETLALLHQTVTDFTGLCMATAGSRPKCSAWCTA